MVKGFLKTVGASKRMRFVKSGYDADDLSLDYANVLFDSDTVGNLSIYARDTITLGPFYHTGVIVNGFVATWPTLSYTPFMTVQYKTITSSGGALAPDRGFSHAAYGIDTANFRVQARPGGLWLFWNKLNTFDVSYVALKWQAYRSAM